MSTLGLGVIGTGDRAIGYLQDVFNAMAREGVVRIIGVTDSNSVRATQGRRDLGAQQVFKDHRQLLASPGLDAVFVMTPDHAHAPYVIDALRAGKHVFCEKPMATTIEDCNRMAEAAHSAKGIFFAGHNVRHGMGRTVHRLLQEGSIGSPRMVFARRFVDGAKYWHRWHRTQAGSGGLLVHKGCHYMDQLNWYAGGRPRYVSAFGGLDVITPDKRPDAPRRCRECHDHCEHYLDLTQNERSVRYFLNAEHEDGYFRDQCVYAPGSDVFDHAVVNIEYDNGVKGCYQECHFAPISDLSSELGVVGDRGMIHARFLVDGEFEIMLSHDPEKTVEVVPMDMQEPISDEAVIRDFVRCAKQGIVPPSGIEAGWDSAVLGLAAQASAARRVIMEISHERREILPAATINEHVVQPLPVHLT